MRAIRVVACYALVLVLTTLMPASAQVCTAGGTTHGYLLDKEGSFTTIDVPGASSTVPLGINARGDIVGRYSAGGITHGFLLGDLHHH